jgi:hypothetical protein
VIPASYYLSLDPKSPELGSSAFAQREAEFYGSIRTSNATWKTTSRRRLDTINALFFEVAGSRLPVRPVVFDVGASSGISTLEWLAEFDCRDVPVKMVAIDRALSFYLVDLALGCKALVEPNGTVVQIEAMGRGFRVWCGKRDYLNGTFLFRKALYRLARSRLSAVRLPIKEAGDFVTGPHLLISPALKGRSDVTVVEDDILCPSPEYRSQADVVRLANVMQRSYFSDIQLRAIARSVFALCRGAGAFVILCRNLDNGELQGSILRAHRTGFSVEAQIGGGSEVERHFADVE